MLRKLLMTVTATAALVGGPFAMQPAHADVCVFSLFCAAQSSCTGIVNYCPNAASCSGRLNICQNASSCTGTINICDTKAETTVS